MEGSCSDCSSDKSHSMDYSRLSGMIDLTARSVNHDLFYAYSSICLCVFVS